MQKTYTKTEQKKQPWKFGNVAGAKKVAENSYWVVYKIDTYAAAKKLGTNNWCIVRNEEFWNDYKKGKGHPPSIFYFALSKIASYGVSSGEDTPPTPGIDLGDRNIEYENPAHRIAIQVLDGQEIYWDAEDDAFDSLSDMDWRHKKSQRDFPPPFPRIKYGIPDYFCEHCENGLEYCECCDKCGERGSSCVCEQEDD